jgi:ABC-type lipoprotein export system ATPase subunit
MTDTRVDNRLHIKIENLLALKNVSFAIEKGISVIAGLNGSGKSQLLLAIWKSMPSHNYLERHLKHYGFQDSLKKEIEDNVSWGLEKPSLILYRPAIRKIAENNREKEYANIKPLGEIIDSDKGTGYSYQEHNRFLDFYAIIAGCFMWGTNKDATEGQKYVWSELESRFESVFEKKLCGSGGPYQGVKVGIPLADGTSTSLNTLSTGELEFLSLLHNLLSEHEKSGMTKRADMILIDELDAHFHPDLQRKIIENISDLCQDKYVLITTHSPAVMLSVDSEHLFYLEKAEKCIDENGVQLNQISSLANNSALFRKIVDMYAGLFTDAKIANFMRDADKYLIQKFTDECLRESNVLEGKSGKSYDTQISYLRAAIATIIKPATLLEVGCGKGRTLAMLNDFDDATLNTLTYIGADISEANLSEIDAYADEIGIKEKLYDFQTCTELDGALGADICVFANVLHEFGAENIERELLKYLSCVKENGKVCILETLQLFDGESNYVILYPDAFKALLKPSCESGAIVNASYATPSSFKDIPLMEVTFTIVAPKNIVLDVNAALRKVIELDRAKLVKHKNGTTVLDGLSYAFVVNNLANAVIGIRSIEELSQ